MKNLYLLICSVVVIINIYAADYKPNLALAIWQNNCAFVEENITQENANRLINGNSPLHYAAKFGRKDIAKILLQHGADAAAKDSTGRTPWLIALQQANLEIIELLDHWEDFRDIKGAIE